MITREQAWELIDKQLIDCPRKLGGWHYGREELKVLLDAIYGEYKPTEGKV